MGKKADVAPPKIYLGDWLDEFEIKNGAAAEMAGCDQSYISNIMAGRKKNINALYLLRLSEAFDLNINDFFRPLPSQSQITALQGLSPKAQAAILNPKKKKA